MTGSVRLPDGRLERLLFERPLHHPQQDLAEAVRLMSERQVRRLPVVEDDGTLVGVVSQADVARQGSDAETGQLVQEISE